MSRDGDDEVNSVRINSTARTSLTEIDYYQTKTIPPVDFKTSVPMSFDGERNAKSGCDTLTLLKTCWSWFCGLDGDPEEDSATANEDAYHSLQKNHGKAAVPEEDDFMLQHSQIRPWIKWVLNCNLGVVIIIEIVLFIVFSLPVKYTFWRE